MNIKKHFKKTHTHKKQQKTVKKHNDIKNIP